MAQSYYRTKFCRFCAKSPKGECIIHEMARAGAFHDILAEAQREQHCRRCGQHGGDDEHDWCAPCTNAAYADEARERAAAKADRQPAKPGSLRARLEEQESAPPCECECGCRRASDGETPWCTPCRFLGQGVGCCDTCAVDVHKPWCPVVNGQLDKLPDPLGRGAQ